MNHVLRLQPGRLESIFDVRICRTQKIIHHVKAVQKVEHAGLDDGWEVEVTSPAITSGVSAKIAVKGSKSQKKNISGTRSPKEEKKTKAGRTRSPFMDVTSEEGILGLTLLQQKLKRAEEGKSGGLTFEDTRNLINDMPQIARKAAAKKQGVLGYAPAPPKKKKAVVYEDDDGNTWEETEDEDVTDKPSFELNLMDEDMEYVEYDRKGNVISRTAPGEFKATEEEMAKAAGISSSTGVDEIDDEELDELDDEDDFDFSDDTSGDAWKAVATVANASQGLQLESEYDDDGFLTGGRQVSGKKASASQTALPDAEAVIVVKGGKKISSQARKDALEVEAMLGDTGVEGMGGMLDDDEQQDWGLEELGLDAAPKDKQLSLMQVLGVTKGKGSKGRPLGVDEELGVTVTWGGSASSSATDLEEQERLLLRMFKPHKVAKLMAHQKAALQEAEALRRGGSARGNAARTQKSLRIVGGAASGKLLLSSQGPQTRPMMEKVRQAIFNMLQSQAGTVNCLPAEARWLDLFAGTGSVGLEALSRGCREAHFVEMDPWTTRNVLGKNITACSFQRQSIVHTIKAEDFLRKAISVPRFAGGAFDFISMCPPYLLVSYPELFQLLGRTGLLHPRTILFVEYPRQLSDQIPETVGELVQVRNRKYGRTLVVVYGPATMAGDQGESFNEDY
ncbi:hypothetical protein CEUSTIGMA_g2133.t1 [Chlamydomonas eustigma]|uniref:Uncharacterized protein n=1 Tax=Chlamydomonas eustigma TaxID=1157962 RepID=A0A250WV56_9CHLO|nr:hypothetical protein CEUSTIGMA_g2133.t1 [Chlamydomonas eustigma]|eukprot:GAX74685.1 hypothetical protein CEUSTIGMA_g2133.t1 [Chlamydomonas eustigma]